MRVKNQCAVRVCGIEPGDAVTLETHDDGLLKTRELREALRLGELIELTDVDPQTVETGKQVLETKGKK